MGHTKAHCRRGWSVVLAVRNFLKTACTRHAATVASRVDSAVMAVWARIVFFLLLRMSQRWRGLNAIGHSTGQRVAVMHPLGILSFIETSTAATLWVGSSATDKLCATLRNPARSHHPVFPRWRRDKCTTCSGWSHVHCPNLPVLCACQNGAGRTGGRSRGRSPRRERECGGAHLEGRSRPWAPPHAPYLQGVAFVHCSPVVFCCC